MRFLVTQFGAAGVGWEVDPVGRDCLSEDVGGGLLAGGDDERFVCSGAAGHGDVEVADVGGLVEQGATALDVASLGAHHGARVGEFDVLGDISRWEVDGAVFAGDGDRFVVADVPDCPDGAVADHLVAVGGEGAVVLACRDLVTDMKRVRADCEMTSVRVDLTGTDA